MASIPLDAELFRQLEATSTEMKSDKFWRDMAQPIDAGLRHLREEAEAFDSISAKHSRKKALEALQISQEQLDKASENNLFVAEARLMATVLAQLRGDVDVEEALQQAEDAKKTKFVPPAKATGAAPTAPVFDEAAAREKPFAWEQDDEGTVSVKISVPPECAKGDVTVTFGAQRLSVSVKGHPLQPHVIDGALLYGIRSYDSSWALEGKGTKRALVVSLEKADTEVEWQGLLDDEAGRKKKGLSELAAGIEGIEGGALKTYGS